MGLITFLMIAVNIIFFAFGGTMLGVGIWMAVDPSAFDGLDASGMDDAMWAAMVYTMIGVGAFVFVVGFLGCCGAKRGGEGKKNIMLKVYNGLVGVVILAEAVIVILAAIFWSNINDNVKVEMQIDVKQNYKGPLAEDGISVSWNKMQNKWKCCGAFDYTDYQNSNFTSSAIGTVVPYTCCVYKNDGDYKDPDNVENMPECFREAQGYNMDKTFRYLNARGCYNELYDFFSRNSAIIIGVTCGIIGLQILGIVFSCIIMCK